MKLSNCPPNPPFFRRQIHKAKSLQGISLVFSLIQFWFFEIGFSLCSPGCPGTQRPTCLCPPSAEIKGVHHQCRAEPCVFKDGKKMTPVGRGYCISVSPVTLQWTQHNTNKWSPETAFFMPLDKCSETLRSGTHPVQPSGQKANQMSFV